MTCKAWQFALSKRHSEWPRGLRSDDNPSRTPGIGSVKLRILLFVSQWQLPRYLELTGSLTESGLERASKYTVVPRYGMHKAHA